MSIVKTLFVGMVQGEIMKAGIPLATIEEALEIPADTPFPIARAVGLVSQFGVSGNQMLGVAVSNTLSNVRAYAAQQGTGYALMLFNLDESNAATITVGVANAPASSWLVDMTTYDKALYD